MDAFSSGCGALEDSRWFLSALQRRRSLSHKDRVADFLRPGTKLMRPPGGQQLSCTRAEVVGMMVVCICTDGMARGEVNWWTRANFCRSSSSPACCPISKIIDPLRQATELLQRIRQRGFQAAMLRRLATQSVHGGISHAWKGLQKDSLLLFGHSSRAPVTSATFNHPATQPDHLHLLIRGISKAVKQKQPQPPSTQQPGFSRSGALGAGREHAQHSLRPPDSVSTASRPGTSGSSTEGGEGKRQKGASHTQSTVPQQRRLQLAAVSPNMLAEPYRGDPHPIAWSAYLGRAGWRERWKRLLSSAKSVYTMAKCKRNIPGFDLAKFKAEALKLYTDINRMVAEGDRSGLRHVITPGEMTNVKRQLKAREDGGWKRIEWSLAVQPALRDLEVLQGRLVAIDPKNDSLTFAQLTVRFRARHRFAAVDARGQVVAGDRAATIAVQDVWVFEHSFHNTPQARWRLAGRLGGISPAR